jgi:hypothetical protein
MGPRSTRLQGDDALLAPDNLFRRVAATCDLGLPDARWFANYPSLHSSIQGQLAETWRKSNGKLRISRQQGSLIIGRDARKNRAISPPVRGSVVIHNAMTDDGSMKKFQDPVRALL